VPIVAVNIVAFLGQLAYLSGHLAWPLAGQILVAATLESVAVYLAWQAHLALIADDAAFRLRLAAYAVAAVIGVMNYSHFAGPGWRPAFTAVAFGMCSVLSPWLWSVHSRRVSRDALKDRGLIEPHAVRLGGTRWAWHPLDSFRVMRRATWTGETDPVSAIAAWAREDSGEDPVLGTPRRMPPLPAPDRTGREPRRATARAARPAGLAAGQARVELAALELLLAREIAATALPWPGEQRLAREEPRLRSSRRSAHRVLALARSMSNGHGTRDDVASRA
jgi:hypothetical protein